MSGDALIGLNTRMAELSVCYINTIASYCGYGADAPHVDHDSVDVTISSSSGRKAKLDIQLKATTKIDLSNLSNDQHFSYPLPIKNYDDLRVETISPRILVVLCMPDTKDDWIKHSEEELSIRKCAFWVSLQGQPETSNKETISVKIPIINVLSPEALDELMSKADKGEDL